MQRDHYLECFKQLDSYIFERSISEAFAELGGIERELPQLDNTLIKSCYISYYLSNDLEQKWIRFLQIECTSSLIAAAVHKRFHSMAKANKDLSITFAGDDETILCTEFSREVLKVQAFDGSGSTQLFLSSQLSGFNANEAATFLANPLVELAPQADLVTRLVSAQCSRTVADGQFTARRLEQRWTVVDVKPAMERLIAAANSSNHWMIDQSLTMTEAGPIARLRHALSADIIQLDAVDGHGQLELRAKRL